MEKTIEILEDVKINQEDKVIILEKGDRIEVLKEFGPLKSPAFGSQPRGRQIRVDYPMDTIRVGDVFTAKRGDNQGIFSPGDKIEILDSKPFEIGRGTKFYVKVTQRNGKTYIPRSWVHDTLVVAIGDVI